MLRSLVRTTIMGYIEKYWGYVVEGFGTVFALPCMLLFRHSFGERVVRLRYLFTQYVGFKFVLFILPFFITIPEVLPDVWISTINFTNDPRQQVFDIIETGLEINLQGEYGDDPLGVMDKQELRENIRDTYFFGLRQEVIFLIAFFSLYIGHRLLIVIRNRKGIDWYSQSFGTSHLYPIFHPVRRWIGHREVQTFIEPLILLLLSVFFSYWSGFFSLYFFIAAFSYFAFEIHRYGKIREEYLELRDHSLKGKAYERLFREGWEGAVLSTGDPMIEISGIQVGRGDELGELLLIEDKKPILSLDTSDAYRMRVLENKGLTPDVRNTPKREN